MITYNEFFAHSSVIIGVIGLVFDAIIVLIHVLLAFNQTKKK